MASPAQITANQLNAQLSTGPKSPAGKAASSANSRKDGLTAQSPVVSPDQQPAFDDFRRALRHDTRPEGALEGEYFQRLLTCGWNLRRARALESTLLAETNPVDDEVAAAKLHRIARYRRDLERSYDRALTQLRQLQTQRAVLLQQDASVVNAVSTITPVADLTRITDHTAPFVGFVDPFRPAEAHFFHSRAAGRRELRDNPPASQNEPKPPTPLTIGQALLNPTLREKDRRAIVDAYIHIPQAAAK